MKSFIRTCALAAAVCTAPAYAVPYIDLGGFGSGRAGQGNIGLPAEGTHFTRDFFLPVFVFGADTPASQTFVDLAGTVGAVTGSSWPVPVEFSSVRLMSADGLTTYDSVTLADGLPQLSFSFSRVAAGQSYRLAFAGHALSAPDDPDFLFFPVREWGYSVTATMSSPAPEASSLIMAAVGVAGVIAWSRRKQAKSGAKVAVATA